MSKAEYKAFERCPKSENVTKEMRNQIRRNIFCEGYHQAEKDLELSWEDIQLIWNIFDEIANDDAMEERLKTMSEEEYCQEVLKRYKAQKEK